jgi:hypothetical protein
VYDGAGETAGNDVTQGSGTVLSCADIAALAARAVYFRPQPGEPVALLPGFASDRSFVCAGPGTGFYATGFVAADGRRLVLAICGSDEPLDVAACMNLAVCQYRANRSVLLEYAADPHWGQISLAGHSLGGAICQYLAYDLLIEVTGIGERLDVWTFNGLGGLLGLRRLHSEFSEAKLRRIRATHYAHPDDVVPLIGGNIAGELRLLAGARARADSHSMQHFLPTEARSVLTNSTAVADRPFAIPRTAEHLGPRLRDAVLEWQNGRRLRPALRLLAMLPAVPREERREVVRMLVSMSAFPFKYRRAMRASAERLRRARALAGARAR